MSHGQGNGLCTRATITLHLLEEKILMSEVTFPFPLAQCADHICTQTLLKLGEQ